MGSRSSASGPLAHMREQAGLGGEALGHGRVLHKTPDLFFLIAKPYLHYSLLPLSYHNNPLYLFIFSNPGPRGTLEQSIGRGDPTTANPVVAD